jgi:hypothetical protein
MDHHEAGERGRSDRLPRQILICVCGVGFFIGALLPGCALLAALRWYVLKNGLQSSDRRNIFKTHRKKDSSSFWNCLVVFWLFPERISALHRGKSNKSWQTGVRNSFWGRFPPNSEIRYYEEPAIVLLCCIALAIAALFISL